VWQLGSNLEPEARDLLSARLIDSRRRSGWWASNEFVWEDRGRGRLISVAKWSGDCIWPMRANRSPAWWFWREASAVSPGSLCSSQRRILLRRRFRQRTRAWSSHGA
jgi:hypothetical protein